MDIVLLCDIDADNDADNNGLDQSFSLHVTESTLTGNVLHAVKLETQRDPEPGLSSSSCRRPSHSTPHFIASRMVRTTRDFPDDIWAQIAQYLGPDDLQWLVHIVDSPNLRKVHLNQRFRKVSFVADRKSVKDMYQRVKQEGGSEYIRELYIQPWRVDAARNRGSSLWDKIRDNLRPLIHADRLQKEFEDLRKHKLSKDFDRIMSCLEKSDLDELSFRWVHGAGHLRSYTKFLEMSIAKTRHTLRKVTMHVPIRTLCYLAPMYGEHSLAIEEFNVSISAYEVAPNDVSASCVRLADWMNSLPSLHAFSLHIDLDEPSSPCDISPLFNSLGSFKNLQTVALSIPAAQTYLSCPGTVNAFLKRNQGTLRSISFASPPLPSPRAGGDQIYPWAHTVMASINKDYKRLTTVQLPLLPVEGASRISPVKQLLKDHIDQIERLYLRNHAFTYQELQELFDVKEQGTHIGVTHLTLQVMYNSPELWDLLASSLPDLRSIEMWSHSVTSEDPSTGGSPDGYMRFKSEIELFKEKMKERALKNVYKAWRLSTIKLNVASGIKETMQSVLPSLKHFEFLKPAEWIHDAYPPLAILV
ncbi:hypothetical protein BDN72DRAFT_857100 [Pluteus cervinus]|uniref:Uncharacterized protein n=1 Tax=Pluteus cervinus TaxID=181527 RepID=A0ACD3AX03_9AGAR|nr:hypothetical protein BDN72DRAFT_857100 [Pluteus cervinus]